MNTPRQDDERSESPLADFDARNYSLAELALAAISASSNVYFQPSENRGSSALQWGQWCRRLSDSVRRHNREDVELLIARIPLTDLEARLPLPKKQSTSTRSEGDAHAL